jgi:formamidopyrimidine-DNA glycosylase
MPELPEVETVRRGLQALLPGRIVNAVDFDFPKGFPNAPGDVEAFLIGATVTEVRRRAKVLIIGLDSAYTLVIHLKMTGQMVFVAHDARFGAGHPNASLVAQLPDKSTRVTFTFTDGSHLYFNDFRKFGWVRLLADIEVPELDFFKKVGPEPLSDEFTADEFIARLQRRQKTSIKAALLDQTVLAGVGNIYADESLWGAMIHPAAKVADVPESKLRKLYEELRYVMNLAIEKGGSTDKNYVDAEGKRGTYLDFARVFRKEGSACPRCGATVVKSRAAGRGTHTCPVCQPPPDGV